MSVLLAGLRGALYRALQKSISCEHRKREWSTNNLFRDTKNVPGAMGIDVRFAEKNSLFCSTWVRYHLREE